MLVDVLGALCAGRAAFEDTARAIEDLATALRYGSNTASRTVVAGAMRGSSHLLPSVLGRATGKAADRLAHRRIEQVVVFVATKADHVPALRRDNLRHLLRAPADAGTERRGGSGAGVSHRVAASVLSTEDGTAPLGGRVVEVVKGIKLGEERMRPFFVGDVPASLLPESFWADRLFEFPVFKPPPIDPHGVTGIPHLNLDQVLDDVIGDLL